MEIYLENTKDYVLDGTIKHKLPYLLQSARTEDFCVYTIHYFPLFKESVLYTRWIDHASITSTVCRCVEYGYAPQLQFLLLHIDRLLILAGIENPSLFDKRLMLRKIDIKVYLIAKTAGFYDPEFEARISAFQTIWRNHKSGRSHLSKGIIIPYTSSTPEDYGYHTREDDEKAELDYWGYRHTTYFVRWNPTKRYQILKRITSNWWGDCRYEAYCNYLKEDEELLKTVFLRTLEPSQV